MLYTRERNKFYQERDKKENIKENENISFVTNYKLFDIHVREYL